VGITRNGWCAPLSLPVFGANVGRVGMSAPIRIATVDDHRPFRDAARALVRGMPGFELVGESEDGEGALRLVQEADPDMVLLDVRMSGLDGIEVASRLSAEDPSRVIVLVSSNDLRPLAGLARSCGADALVHKHWLTRSLLRGLWAAHRRR
jgi:DNA-binding NarL/FixJ family response regulator